jgi:hypothetical protein
MHTVRDEYFLTIGEIAEEYGRNGQDRLQALFNAFWRGCFEAFVRETESEEYPLMSRRTALKAWRDMDDHPGLEFATSPGEEIRVSDGSIVVDLFTRIVLPAEEVDWKRKELEITYGHLANLSVADISGAAEAGLKCQFLGAYELLAVLYDQGEPPPPFWLHWDSTRRPSRHEESKSFQHLSGSANWLSQELPNAAPTDVRQLDLLQEAKNRGLGEEQFNKLWRALAPDQLKEGGAGSVPSTADLPTF